MVECDKCGTEHESDKEISCKVLTYELVLNDGRSMQFTRSYDEPVGKFYDWICNTVLPATEHKEPTLVLNTDKVTLPLHITPADLVVERATQSERQLLEQDVKTIGDHIEEHRFEIQREDIVKCVKVHPRDEDADVDLEVGGQYRVLSIKKDRGQVTSYDLINDNSTVQFRITCAPDEIELLRKRKIKTNPVKTDYKQEIMKCSNCQTENALDLTPEGDKYSGKCTKCKAQLIMPSAANAKSTT